MTTTLDQDTLNKLKTDYQTYLDDVAGTNNVFDETKSLNQCFKDINQFVIDRENANIDINDDTQLWYGREELISDTNNAFYADYNKYEGLPERLSGIGDYGNRDTDLNQRASNILQATIDKGALLSIQDLIGIDTATLKQQGLSSGGWSGALSYWDVASTHYDTATGQLTSEQDPTIGEQMTSHLAPGEDFDGGGAYDQFIAVTSVKIEEFILLGKYTLPNTFSAFAADLNNHIEGHVPNSVLGDLYSRLQDMAHGESDIGSPDVIDGHLYDEATGKWAFVASSPTALDKSPLSMDPLADVTAPGVNVDDLNKERQYRLDHKGVTADDIRQQLHLPPASHYNNGPNASYGTHVNADGSYTTIRYNSVNPSYGYGGIFEEDIYNKYGSNIETNSGVTASDPSNLLPESSTEVLLNHYGNARYYKVYPGNPIDPSNSTEYVDNISFNTLPGNTGDIVRVDVSLNYSHDAVQRIRILTKDDSYIDVNPATAQSPEWSIKFPDKEISLKIEKSGPNKGRKSIVTHDDVNNTTTTNYDVDGLDISSFLPANVPTSLQDVKNLWQADIDDAMGGKQSPGESQPLTFFSTLAADFNKGKGDLHQCFQDIESYINSNQDTLKLNQETLSWYKQALHLTAPTSGSTVSNSADGTAPHFAYGADFVKFETQYGEKLDGKTLSDLNEKELSDDISKNIIQVILEKKSILSIDDLMSIDRAITNHDGISSGGWGSSLYYWKSSFSEYKIDSSSYGYHTTGHFTKYDNDYGSPNFYSLAPNADFDKGGQFDKLIASNAAASLKTLPDSYTKDGIPGLVAALAKEDATGIGAQAPWSVKQDVIARMADIKDGNAIVGAADNIDGNLYDTTTGTWSSIATSTTALGETGKLSAPSFDKNDLNAERTYRLAHQDLTYDSLNGGPAETPFMSFGTHFNADGSYSRIQYLQADPALGQAGVYQDTIYNKNGNAVETMTGSMTSSSDYFPITRISIYDDNGQSVATEVFSGNTAATANTLDQVTFTPSSSGAWSKEVMYFDHNATTPGVTKVDVYNKDGSSISLTPATGSSPDWSVSYVSAKHKVEKTISYHEVTDQNGTKTMATTTHDYVKGTDSTVYGVSDSDPTSYLQAGAAGTFQAASTLWNHYSTDALNAPASAKSASTLASEPLTDGAIPDWLSSYESLVKQEMSKGTPTDCMAHNTPSPGTTATANWPLNTHDASNALGSLTTAGNDMNSAGLNSAALNNAGLDNLHAALSANIS